MSPPTNDSSNSSESESPPAKRSLVIDSYSIEPIARQQHYLKSKTKEFQFLFQWTIENISYYCLSAADSPKKYTSISSSTFSSPSNDKFRFYLKLYPNGSSENSKGNLSLYIRFDNCDPKELAVKFNYCIIDSEGFPVNSFGDKTKFGSSSNCWGCAKFCAHEHILASSSKLAPGDVLTILCSICHDDTVEEESCDLDKIALTQLEKDCLELSQNKELSDVVLVFGDGKDKKKEFAVHSAIVSARSCVFAAMFEHEMKEKNKRRVEITDVDAEVGQKLVNYLYGENSISDEFVERLLPIADKYQLHSLKSICEGALCFRINPKSVGNLLLLADMHQADLLKSKCIDYIHCHSSCVLENDHIQDVEDIMQTRPELYYDLFKQIPQDSCNIWSPPTLTNDPFTLRWSYTTSRVHKCSKIWTIEKFDEKHLSDDDYDAKYPHDFIETSVFPSPNSNDNLSVQFSVKLFPYGENDDCTKHLSLQLQLKCDDKMKVAVKVKASIMVKDNSAKGYTLEIGKKLSNGESIGWPKFITRDQLMENEDLLLNGNDQFVLLFEVFYIENIDKAVTKSGVNTFADEHKFSIARDLSQFYSNQKLTDIVFVLGNKTFSAHKSIVSARSSVFAQMFKPKSRTQIKDVDDVESFSDVLALVYGQTEPLTHSAHKMLPLLDKFELNCLKRVCEISLCALLDDTNVVDFLLLADKHKASQLKAKAFEYIRRKHSVLTQNDSLKVIQQQRPKLFHELLCYKLDNWRDPTDE